MLLNKIEELTALTGLKYSIGLEVLLRKDNTNGTPTCTNPPSRFYTEQKVVLNHRPSRHRRSSSAKHKRNLVMI